MHVIFSFGNLLWAQQEELQDAFWIFFLNFFEQTWVNDSKNPFCIWRSNDHSWNNLYSLGSQNKIWFLLYHSCWEELFRKILWTGVVNSLAASAMILALNSRALDLVNCFLWYNESLCHYLSPKFFLCRLLPLGKPIPRLSGGLKKRHSSVTKRGC